VRWLPFQLNPDLPVNGIARSDYILKKFGPGGRANYDRVAKVGESVGIHFEFDNITVQPNTLKAHRLLHYAVPSGQQNVVSTELFKAYFIEGKNLTDVDTLSDIAQSAGLDRSAVHEYLGSQKEEAEVAEADLQARRAGVSGVPFFIFNHAVGLSGAQEPETLLQAMLQALEPPADSKR
jgi:predicted DsbA family dithiol-disulfide isomerase